MRPSKYETYMEIAKMWAKQSTCSARVAVGAVIVNKFGQVIASGYNGSPRGHPHCDEVGCDLDALGHCKRAIHAELNAILQCARVGVSCDDCFIYITHSPCPRCSLMIAQSGIIRVVYDNQYGDLTDSSDILAVSRIPMVPFVKEVGWTS
jgi:dCMP deaminase